MTIFALAKKIRRKNEPWQKAIQRARVQHNRNKQKGGTPTFMSTARKALGATDSPDARDGRDIRKSAISGFLNSTGSLAQSMKDAAAAGLGQHIARQGLRDAWAKEGLHGTTEIDSSDKLRNKFAILSDSNKVHKYFTGAAFDKIKPLSEIAGLKGKIDKHWEKFKGNLARGKEAALQQLNREISDIESLAESLGISSPAAEAITNNVRKAINEGKARLFPDERVKEQAVDVLNETIYKEKMALIEAGVLKISEVDETNRDNWVKSTIENQDKYDRLMKTIPIWMDLQEDLITLLRDPQKYEFDPASLANTLESIKRLIQGLAGMTTDLLDKYKQSELNYIQALGIIHQKGNSGGPPQIELIRPDVGR